MGSLVDVRTGERGPTLAAFATLFTITAGHTMLETARDALFLAKLPASRLPFMYVAIATLGLVVARLPKGGGKRALFVALAGSAGVTALLWVLAAAPSPALLYALFIWTGTFGSWIVLELWLLFGAGFDVGQAKRLFGFIGAGAVLGATAGAGVARILAPLLGARHLLLAGAALFVLAILPLAATGADRSAPRKVATARTSLGSDARVVLGDAYLVRILALTMLATLTVTTVDYVFKAGVAARTRPEDLGATFASVYFVMNALAFAVQLLAVAPLLRVLGVQRALVLLPVAIALGGGGLAVTGALAAAYVMKGFDGALRHSLHRTTVELLYLPLADETRARAKPVIDLVAGRGGQALASIAIFAVVLAGAGERTLAVGASVLALAWAAIAVSIGAPYLDVFRSNLKRGRLDAQANLPELDMGALEALFAALNSPRDAEVVGALDLLAAQRKHRVIPALILYHPSTAVVLRALDIFTVEGRDDFVPITDRLLAHPDRDVRAAALRARARVAFDADALRAHLGETAMPELQATALVTLVGRGGFPEDEGARRIAAMLADPDERVRSAVARAIAEEPRATFASALVDLGRRERVAEVRVEVARAMGSIGRLLPSAEMLEVLASWIMRRHEGSAARQAMAAFGAPAAAWLRAALVAADQPLDRTRAIPRALGEVGGADAVEALYFGFHTCRDNVVRYRCLKNLVRLVARDPALTVDPAAIATALAATIDRAFTRMAYRAALERAQAGDAARASAAGKLLVELLRDKQRYAESRIFLLLAILHPKEDFERVQRGLAQKDAKTRASSRELLDGVVTGADKGRLLLLFDDLPDAEKVSRAGRTLDLKGDYDALLAEVAELSRDVAVLVRFHGAELGRAVAPSVDAEPIYGALAARLRDERPHAAAVHV